MRYNHTTSELRSPCTQRCWSFHPTFHNESPSGEQVHRGRWHIQFSKPSTVRYHTQQHDGWTTTRTGRTLHRAPYAYTPERKYQPDAAHYHLHCERAERGDGESVRASRRRELTSKPRLSEGRGNLGSEELGICQAASHAVDKREADLGVQKLPHGLAFGL